MKLGQPATITRSDTVLPYMISLVRLQNGFALHVLHYHDTMTTLGCCALWTTSHTPAKPILHVRMLQAWMDWTLTFWVMEEVLDGLFWCAQEQSGDGVVFSFLTEQLQEQNNHCPTRYVPMCVHMTEATNDTVRPLHNNSLSITICLVKTDVRTLIQ